MISVCTAEATSVLGSHSGLVQLVREKNFCANGIHFIIHHVVLVAKTLPYDIFAEVGLVIEENM